MNHEDMIAAHMLAPQGASEAHVVELLTFVAHFHRTGHRLALGDSVNFGRAWLPNASCTYGLISLPYLDGVTLEWDGSTHTRFLWLIPITDREVAFKKEHGTEALEKKLEEQGPDYLDIGRASLV